MSITRTSVRVSLRVLVTLVASAACGTVDTHAPTIGCAPLDGSTIIDGGHGGGRNAARVNGCQPGINVVPPGATGNGGSTTSGAGGLTGDGGAFGTGGAPVGMGGTLGLGGAIGAGGAFVTGGVGVGIGGSLTSIPGSFNAGAGG
jgi:hypothetical protein